MLKLIKVTMNQSEQPKPVLIKVEVNESSGTRRSYFVSTRTQVDRFGRESERYNLHSDVKDAESFQAEHAESIVKRLKAHVQSVEIKEAA